MKNTFCLLLSALWLVPVAAQPQQPPQQTVRMNVGSVQGVAPGYNATAGSGLTLNLSPGTVFCGGAIQSYAGGTLTMAPSATNYVYLNPSANCAPATNTSGFTAGLIPVATVVTGSAAITAVTDNRTMFTSGGSGIGTCAANQFVSGVNLGSPTCTQPAFSNLTGAAVPAQLPSATGSAQGAIQLAGDLSNTAAAPKVAGIQGVPVSSNAPANGQVHQFNSSLNQWVPTTLPAPATVQVNGTNTASQATLNLQSGSNITVTNPSAGNVSIALSGTLPSGMLPMATWGAPGAIQLTGDLGGTAGSPKVTWLQGYALSSTAPSTGQCLVYGVSSWAPGPCAGLPSSWATNSTNNAVTAQPMSGQDAVPLTLAPSVASPTADILDICSTSPCSAGTKYVWVSANGNLNFLGNNTTYGSPSQSTQSFLRLYGSTASSNLAPPYFDLEKTDGSVKSYLAPSTTLNGVVGVSSAIPGSDIQAPAGAFAGTISGGAGSGPVIVVANSAAGTTNGLLAKLTGSGNSPTATTAGISDTAVPVYPVVTGGASSGNAALSVNGIAQCTFDGATTINHFVQASTTVAGDCHDAGAAPTSGWVIGQVMSTNAAGGLYNVQVGPPGYSAASGGSGSGTVTADNGSAGALSYYASAGGSTSVGPDANLTDASNTLTYSGSGGVSASSFTATGSGAGYFEAKQGAAPSLVANQVQLVAPASVANSGEAFVYPGTPATGLQLWTNSSGTLTGSFLSGAANTVLVGQGVGSAPSFGSVPTAALANPATTVNGQACALGSLCNANNGAAQYSVAVNGAANAAIAGVALGAHQTLIGALSANPSAKTIPDCQDSGGNHLNYTQSTDVFSCGTTSSGGGGASVTVNAQTGNYTAASTDCGNAIDFTISSNATLTLPQAGTSSMNAGCAITVSNKKSGGILTVATTASTIGGVVHKFIGLGGQAKLISDGANWSYFGSENQLLCAPPYSSNIGDLLSADASGGTHYFGQVTSTQATSLTAFTSSSCVLPANILGAGTLLQATGDFWAIGQGVPNLITGLKLGSTALTNVAGGSILNTAARAGTETFRIDGTAAPGASVMVDAQCIVGMNGGGATGLDGLHCFNSTIPNNNFATNGALTLTLNALWSSATAGDAIWLKQWQVVMLSGPTN
ncbi:MAG TPA: hypothetical protein VKM93_27575 [Terriglobia bacterium]|nr:hypothetical protein [Terriglobia bacterium]